MNHKILVTDDSEVNLMIMRDILFDEGYDVLIARNGKIAIEQSLLHLPDLILMDWQMPVMNGVDALEILKKDSKTNEIPVIMVTGIATTAEHLQEAYIKGAIDFIKKPFEKIELLARVKAILSFVTYHKLAIEHKTNELSAAMLQLSRLTELHEQISIKLAKLKDDFPTVENPVNDIIGNVSVQLLNEAWKRYEENFRELNPLFYKQFLTVHPDITPGEIRLCTLLRLNMSSKEIAVFIHQEESSIRVSRSRLRTKLGLSEATNLVGYLMQF
jgi:DNA-binding response OmpR family regulator/DNA-binding CsgD family transcriptional regulator